MKSLLIKYFFHYKNTIVIQIREIASIEVFEKFVLKINQTGFLFNKKKNFHIEKLNLSYLKIFFLQFATFS